MKKVGLIATIVIAAMLIAGCGNSNNADNKTTVNESLAVSSSVGNTENRNSKIVKENQSSTEVTTTEPTIAETTTRKETTTTQKSTQSNTTTKSATKQSTTQTKQTTTKKETTTQKVTTTKKVTTTEEVWDCNVDGHTSETGQIGWVNSFDEARDKALEYASKNGNSGNFRVEQCHICGKYTAYITFD